MARSTHSPSPARSDASGLMPNSPSMEMSPRSKLQAELAALDKSSDDDGPQRPLYRKALFKQKSPKKVDGSLRQRSDDDIEDVDDEEIARPRGRLAARMRAGPEPDISETISNGPPAVGSAKEADATMHSNIDTDAEEEVITAPRKRRLQRLHRSVTPESAPSAEQDSPKSSPGLFVSPEKSPARSTIRSQSGSDGEDEELPADLTKNARFHALVARKREERLAQEAEEERKREERHARQLASTELLGEDEDEADDDVSDITDDDGGRKLTQGAKVRKPRKASKKALEEMNRETQRMSRALQLAHEARTRKKIPKNTLFERFNFKIAGASPEKAQVEQPDAQIASSSRAVTPTTDPEMETDTPPSSPPIVLKELANLPAPVQQPQIAPQSEGVAVIEGDEDNHIANHKLMHFENQVKTVDKGKSVATAVDTASPKKTKPKRQVRVRLPPSSVQANLVTIDSDDELQIGQPQLKKQSRLDALFQKIPAQQDKESRNMQTIRSLAHLNTSPPPNMQARRARVDPKNPNRGASSLAELQQSLQQKARAQAKLERERRLELLKSKGVVVQTDAEREKEREQVEDIVARARAEAEEIMAREREEAKKARQEAKENGEEAGAELSWDESDDESFHESDDDNEPEMQKVEDGEIIFSGSEEEEEEGEVDDEDNNTGGNPMFDEDAEETNASEEEDVDDGILPKATNLTDEDKSMDDDSQPTRSRIRRAKKHVRILSDDEDMEAGTTTHVEATPKAKNPFLFKSPSTVQKNKSPESPSAPASVLRSATKTFIPGLPVPAAGPAGLGLTQIFAGTMDDSQAAGSADPGSGSPMEFMPSFDNFPDSQFSAAAGDSQTGMVLESQTPTQKRAPETQTQNVLQLNWEQSQAHGFDSLVESQTNGTQGSDMLEPTQDGGFGVYSPLKQRFIEPPQSTVDTVVLHGQNHTDSPLVRRQGKLRRRIDVSSGDMQATLPDTAEVPGSPLVNVSSTPRDINSHSETTRNPEQDQHDEDDGVSAFRLMAKAARKKKRLQEKFDKKKSRAAEMIEAQAEESDDEYAGLGGADGEDSSDEEGMEELRQQLIDDEKVGLDAEDERKLAAFFADRERAVDSAQVDKLFRDITTGMLRKRRRGGGGGNGDFDLSDSDDGGEARRRMKRQQFAKMQKALFADERIGKIAEDPRNAAFMKSIEDRDSDDEMDFDDHFVENELVDEEQSQTQPHEEETREQRLDVEDEEKVPDSQPVTTQVLAQANPNTGRKRTRADPSEPAPRPAPGMRKVRSLKDPSYVRQSLSFLLGENQSSAQSVIPATDPTESDSEDELSSSNKENDRLAGSSVAVVDRITLKRSGSSSASTASSRLAFAAPAASSSSSGLFKVPALLRRATTNSLMSQGSTTGPSSSATHKSGHASTSAAHDQGSGGRGFGDEAKLRKNAGKKSGVNFFARENERRERLKVVDRRREEKKRKGVEGRSKAVGSLFGGGNFE